MKQINVLCTTFYRFFIWLAIFHLAIDLGQQDTGIFVFIIVLGWLLSIGSAIKE